MLADVTIRPALLSDLPRLTDIHNFYIVSTHITFDVHPYTPQQRASWFHEHNDGRRYRIFVAEDTQTGVAGYATTGRFRNKPGYDTTVEASVYCGPNAVGKGIGKRLYTALFDALAKEDINRIVAGIAQPNAASNALHERFGFQPIGTFTAVGRKFGKYWDVLWMERPLVLAV